MKNIILTIFLISISNFAQSQKYLTSEVIEKAELYLKKAVGAELFGYFELDPDSYYEYKTILGKNNWSEITKGKKTKGSFVNAHDIRFTLNHPDFQYTGINKNIYVELDSALNLCTEIKLERIPKFLLENKPSNWLTKEQLDSIAKEQNLKSSIKPLEMDLQFDYDCGEYYWEIINTLYEEKGFSDCEFLHVDPISGRILKHTEGRLIFMNRN